MPRLRIHNFFLLTSAAAAPLYNPELQNYVFAEFRVCLLPKEEKKKIEGVGQCTPGSFERSRKRSEKEGHPLNT